MSKSVIEGGSIEHARRGMGTRSTEHAGLGGLKVGGEGGLREHANLWTGMRPGVGVGEV